MIEYTFWVYCSAVISVQHHITFQWNRLLDDYYMWIVYMIYVPLLLWNPFCELWRNIVGTLVCVCKYMTAQTISWWLVVHSLNTEPRNGTLLILFFHTSTFFDIGHLQNYAAPGLLLTYNVTITPEKQISFISWNDKKTVFPLSQYVPTS